MTWQHLSQSREQMQAHTQNGSAKVLELLHIWMTSPIGGSYLMGGREPIWKKKIHLLDFPETAWSSVRNIHPFITCSACCASFFFWQPNARLESKVWQLLHAYTKTPLLNWPFSRRTQSPFDDLFEWRESCPGSFHSLLSVFFSFFLLNSY